MSQYVVLMFFDNIHKGVIISYYWARIKLSISPEVDDMNDNLKIVERGQSSLVFTQTINFKNIFIFYM